MDSILPIPVALTSSMHLSISARAFWRSAFSPSMRLTLSRRRSALALSYSSCCLRRPPRSGRREGGMI